MKPIQIFILLILVIVTPIFGQKKNQRKPLLCLLKMSRVIKVKYCFQSTVKKTLCQVKPLRVKRKSLLKVKCSSSFQNYQKVFTPSCFCTTQNGNYRMDFSENGHPKEAYATSGIKNLYGPPNFKDSSIAFVKDTLVRLRF